MNKKKLRKLKGWKAIVAVVVIGVGTVYEIVHVLEAIDFVMEFMHRPVVRLILKYAGDPRVVLVCILLGFLYLAFLLQGEDDDEKETKRAREHPPVSERAAPAVAPAAERRTPAAAQTALDAAPNLVVVETSLRHVTLAEGRLVEDPNSDIVAAVICIRNDAIRGRQVGEMETTKAHLRFQSLGKVVLNVDAGCWLEEEYNWASFSPGDTHTLVVGVRKIDDGPDKVGIAVPDDRRESSDSWNDLRWKTLETNVAGVHVKLVGGWPKVHVFEFDFALASAPEFRVMGPMNVGAS